MTETSAMVDLATCEKLKNTSLPFILVVHKEQNIIETLIKCMELMQIKSASLSGLGALKKVNIAYYNLETKEYEKKTFSEIYELISFNGNITQVDEKAFAHVHVALGDNDHGVIGGHLFEAVVAVTAEITVIPLAGVIRRQMNCELGLKLIASS
jgi:predicted DNA-binding protein with PD1-like motif